MRNTEYEWPQSFEESFEHYVLPPDVKNLLVLSDVHLPYHNIWALDESINYAIKKKADSILLNGDIMDCYQLSRFQPDPRYRNFEQEIEAFKDFIITLKRHVSNRIYFKLGNHEERYEKIMISRAPEFLSVPAFDFDKILACNELGVQVIKDQRIVYAGRLPIIHGHEVGLKYAVVNPARSLFLKTYKSAICSHLHRTSSHTEQGIDGKTITTWSTGHLSDPHPKWKRINNWNHGICRVEIDEVGSFVVVNFALIKNKIFN